MAVVTLSGVGKSFGNDEVLHQLNAEIQDGEFVAILGESGCGKSTLLRLIAGLEEISQGDVLIDGEVVNTFTPKERNVAMVFQSYALYPHMTVEQNIRFPLKLAGVSEQEQKERTYKAADMLNLTNYLPRKPRDLSGGQRQRVAMGRALVRDPQVFLFDEPLSNLDAKLRVQMRADIRRLQKELGKTAIYVTHDQIEAMTMADRVILMNKGRIEQFGPPLELYDQPASEFVASFVGSPAINLIKGRVEESGEDRFHSDDLSIPLDIKGIPRQTVTVGVRPEHIQIGRTDESRGFSGVISSIECTGDRTFLEVKVGQGSLRVTTGERANFKIEQDITLCFPNEKTHFFDINGYRLPKSN
ncbi:sn-glycerol-3-phosphate ABC transporter ATP-binding protein UgpC [Vibrio sp. SCSIO 43132]|uniref:ABC transporter ATP-binding protein n=1 Tax=Vibrio sp. SCSIO 43132 TaxID=2779363 RepID=UPI001CA7EA4C|nr:sn-glycerol-3-phosphate ABC transporter ATP-binding protein UgpC [Vibrio sp. SCSIO 43132]UAB72319.1 sn-glycerol-3-phosphate ABC transporter ATP-binding protein UgpC [Vibrio sp. SCSIO 43132]